MLLTALCGFVRSANPFEVRKTQFKLGAQLRNGHFFALSPHVLSGAHLPIRSFDIGSVLMKKEDSSHEVENSNPQISDTNVTSFTWLVGRVPKDFQKRINMVIRTTLSQFKKKETFEICTFLKRTLDEKLNRQCGESWNVFAGEAFYYNISFMRGSAGVVRVGVEDPKALKILFYQSAPWEKVSGEAPTGEKQSFKMPRAGYSFTRH